MLSILCVRVNETVLSVSSVSTIVIRVGASVLQVGMRPITMPFMAVTVPLGVSP